MRIAHLTAGTARYYCGTCLRDHTLVAELRKLGHDALMVPLYLPLVAEKPAAEQAPLFLGGVNAFLQQKLALFRKTPRCVDAVLDAPWLLDKLSAWSGMTSAQDLGAMTVAALQGTEGEQAKEFHRAAAWLAAEFRPDVVCLSNALLLGFAPAVRAATGAAIVCSLQGEETFLDQLPEPHRARAWELAARRAAEASALVAVSGWYRDRMAGRLSVPAERIRVVHNGIALDGFDGLPRRAGQAAGGSDVAAYRGDPPAARPALRARSGQPTIGYLAALVPAKGLATLVDAFIALRRRGQVPGARLHVAGSQPPGTAAFVRALMGKLDRAGLLGDCAFAADLTREQKLSFLSGLSVLSVPATYGEAFGLYVLEALAAGVPVVQPDSGAFPELLALTQGGVLCRPHDPDALASGLEGILTSPELAGAMAQRGRDAVFARFGAKHMADAFARVLAEVAPAR